MENTIKCPHCGKDVEITEALKHQVEEQVLAQVNVKHRQELEDIKKKVEEDVGRKIKAQLELELTDKQNAINEAQEQNTKLREQLLEMTKLIRELKEKDSERELEMQKQLTAEKEKIREETLQKYEEQHRLKELELQKQLTDARKVNDELRRKLEQGSQQTQGEVLELDLETLLRETFRDDEIQPVGKGIVGADIRQIVKSPKSYPCGVILWESKRTKSWEDKWLDKLKADLRKERGHLCVLVSQILPAEAKKGIGMKDGVWVCSFDLLIPLAHLLRKSLLDVAYQKAVSTHRDAKADLLFSYVTGHEFHQQVEAIVEVYNEMQEQVARERIAYEKQWKQREAQIRRLLLSTTSIVGTMQGLLGSSTLQIQGLEVPELSSG